MESSSHDVGRDFLIGAEAIAAYLRDRGFKDANIHTVYHAAKKKKLPIGRYGKELFADPRRLDRKLQADALSLSAT